MDGDLEPRLEHVDVRDGDLKVRVSWWTMTGTTHLATELVISTSRGTLTLKDPGEDSDEVLPLIERIYKAGNERWVVLGWSSYGEGMQTEHAWLIGGRSRPRILDKLAWTTDRHHAGLAIDLGDKLRIGIPLPIRSQSDSDEDDHALHNEGDWQLVHGGRAFTLAQVEKLRASEHHVMSVRAYTPPTEASATQRDWSGRFVWFAADTKRFARR